MLGLIMVQAVCKYYQQMKKVATIQKNIEFGKVLSYTVSHYESIIYGVGDNSLASGHI